MEKVIQQKFQIQFTYPVFFTNNLFSTKNLILKNLIKNKVINPKKVLCFVDKGVSLSHPDLLDLIDSYHKFNKKFLDLVRSPLLIQGGEESKNNPKNIKTIHQSINKYGICRHSYILAIGGGAFLDMVGFAAATAHRGIRLIRVPTTTLSQNDSGVGVKNGINAFGKKNFTGSFAPPFAVINDFSFIETLSDRDFRSGISETIKVALLKNRSFFNFINSNIQKLNNRDQAVMKRLTYKCAELHLNHIATSGDPFEMGSSRPLDFGHWSAHKLEQLTNYDLRHGEAVAIGMALDCTYSYLIGYLPKKSWLKIINTIQTLHLPTYHEQLELSLQTKNSVLKGLDEFREHLGGQLTIILLKDIGRPIEVNKIDKNLVLDSIKILKNLNNYGKADEQTFKKIPAHPAAIN